MNKRSSEHAAGNPNPAAWKKRTAASPRSGQRPEGEKELFYPIQDEFSKARVTIVLRVTCGGCGGSSLFDAITPQERVIPRCASCGERFNVTNYLGVKIRARIVEFFSPE